MKASHRKDVIIARINLAIICAALLAGIISLIVWLHGWNAGKNQTPETEITNNAPPADNSNLPPVTEQPLDEDGQSVWTSTDGVNFRAEPNTDSEILTVLVTGTKLTLLGEENGWVQAEYNGQKGYVSSDYVTDQEPDTTTQETEIRKGETMSTAGKIMSIRQDGNEICVKYEQQKLVVKAIRDDIVNIFVPYRTKEHYSKAIDGDKAVATELTAEQKGEDLVIATDKIRMQFGENLEMVITRPDGTPLVRTHRQGRSVCGEVSEQMKQILESEGHDTSNLGAHDYPVQMMFDLDEGDDFYGLGDKTGFLNKKNYEYEIWKSDIPQAHYEDFHALY